MARAASISTDRPRALIGLLLAIAAGCGLAWLLLRETYEGYAQSYDTMIYARSLWGIAHGELFNPVYGVHAFGIHGTFLLALLAPLTWIAPAAIVMIAAQSAALGATVWLIDRAAIHAAQQTSLHRTGVAAWSLAGTVVLIAGSPLLHNPFFFDTHPGVLGIPFVTAGLLRAERLRGFDRWAVLMMLPAVLLREEYAVVIAAALVLAPFGSGAGMTRRARLISAAVLLAYMAIYWFMLRPLFGAGAAADRASLAAADLLGAGDGGGLILTRLEILAVFALSAGGLCALGFRWWGAALPGVVLLLTLTRMHEYVLNFHYSQFAAPAVAVASLRGFSRLLSLRSRRRAFGALSVAVAIATALYLASSAAPGGRRFMADNFAIGASVERRAELDAHRALLQRIPAGEGALVPIPFGAPFVDRAGVWTTESLRAHLRANGDLPEGLRWVALQREDWAGLGRRLAVRHGFRLVGLLPGRLALLERGAAPDRIPWEALGARDFNVLCESPLAIWPSAQLVLCSVEIRGGRPLITLGRAERTDASDAHSVFMFLEPGASVSAGVAAPGGPIGVFLADGLVSLASIPPGAALVVPAERTAPEGGATLRLRDSSMEILPLVREDGTASDGLRLVVTDAPQGDGQ